MADPLLTTVQLGLLLQSARKARGMTQAELGARMGLSQKRVSAIERNPASMTADQLLKQCSILGLELQLAQKGAGVGPADTAAPSTRIEW